MNIADVDRDQMRRFIAAECPWVSIDTAMSNASVIQHAATWVAAGENSMAHHDYRITEHGMVGALQVFDPANRARRAKYNSGSWLVTARKNRIQGRRRDAAICLTYAAEQRRAASSFLKGSAS